MSEKKSVELAPGGLEGVRRATGGTPGAAGDPALKRWSVNRKKEAVLGLLRGGPVEALSRELGMQTYRLEAWREKALAGMDAGLKERHNDPLQAKLNAATRRIGELVMENEILHREREVGRPLGRRRSAR